MCRSLGLNIKTFSKVSEVDVGPEWKLFVLSLCKFCVRSFPCPSPSTFCSSQYVESAPSLIRIVFLDVNYTPNVLEVHAGRGKVRNISFQTFCCFFHLRNE